MIHCSPKIQNRLVLIKNLWKVHVLLYLWLCIGNIDEILSASCYKRRKMIIALGVCTHEVGRCLLFPMKNTFLWIW